MERYTVKELFSDIEFELVFDELVKIRDFDVKEYNLYSKAYQEIINMPDQDIDDQWYIFVAWQKEFDNEEYYHVSLYLVGDEDVTYSPTFSKWNQWLSWNIVGSCIAKYGKVIVAASIFWDMTFFGISEKMNDYNIEDAIEGLRQAEKEIEKGKTIPADEVFAELRESLGLPEKELENEISSENIDEMIDQNKQEIEKLLYELKIELMMNGIIDENYKALKVLGDE